MSTPIIVALAILAMLQLRLLGAKGRVVKVQNGEDIFFEAHVKSWFLVPFWDTLSELRYKASEVGAGHYYHSNRWPSAEAAEAAIQLKLEAKAKHKAKHANDFRQVIKTVAK